MWPQVVFLVLFFAGFDGIMVMLKPWMVDMGYNMREIGLYNGVIGTSVAFVMALFAGWWVKRVGVRTARCLVATAALAVPVYFLALTFLTPSLPLVLTGIILLRAVEASAAVTLYASSMDFVREGREGTDFTVQVVIVHTSGALLATVAGGVGQWLDYRGLCLIELALLYKVGSVSLRANYAMGFRSPGLDELYYHYFADQTSGRPLVTFGNKNLKPEKSHYVGLTAGYDNGIVSAELTGYINSVTDMIVRQAYDIDDAAKEMLKAEFPGEITDASFNSLFTYNRYVNSDRGLVHGVNASVSVRPLSGLALTANYAWTDAKTRSQGVWTVLERSVRNTVTVAADYTHTWWGKYTLNININGRLQGSTYYPGYERAPGYGIWNLNTSHTFRLARHLTIEPGLGIDNIFNQVDRRIYWANRRYANFSSGTAVVFQTKVRF